MSATSDVTPAEYFQTLPSVIRHTLLPSADTADDGELTILDVRQHLLTNQPECVGSGSG